MCDLSADRARAAAAGLPGAVQALDASALLAHSAVDAAIIATPSRAHAAVALSALRAGKHVFVEKPVALLLSDARELVEHARSRGKRFMVGHVLAYHPAVEALIQQIQSGSLGTIQRITSLRHGAGAAHDDEGAWWSFAPHDLSLGRLITGAEPTAVRAIGDHPEAPGEVTAHVQFGNSVTMSIHLSRVAATKTRRLVVQGSLATAVFDDLVETGKLRVFPVSRGPGVAHDHGRIIALRDEAPLVAEARHFVEGVLDDLPIRTDGHEALQVMMALDAGARSIRAGGRVAKPGDCSDQLGGGATFGASSDA